jgi:hypothetical protein
MAEEMVSAGKGKLPEVLRLDGITDGKFKEEAPRDAQSATVVYPLNQEGVLNGDWDLEEEEGYRSLGDFVLPQDIEHVYDVLSDRTAFVAITRQYAIDAKIAYENLVDVPLVVGELGSNDKLREANARLRFADAYRALCEAERVEREARCEHERAKIEVERIQTMMGYFGH